MAGREADFPPAPLRGEARARIGILAIQGDFEAHAKAFRKLDAEVVEVRWPAQLDDLDGLVIPGGESTTISKGISHYELREPLERFGRTGKPVFGTCAGLIVLDRNHLGLMDIEARRNAFGRQVHSFEAEVLVRGLGDEPLEGVFIRAPWIEQHGEDVELLAELEGRPVVARQGNMLVAAFHPELTEDLRLHVLFLALVDRARAALSEPTGGGP